MEGKRRKEEKTEKNERKERKKVMSGSHVTLTIDRQTLMTKFRGGARSSFC